VAHTRTPGHRVADQQACKRLGAIARHAELWGFNKANLCAIVEKGIHLAYLKQYASVASMAITAAGACTMHVVSATNCGVKTTTAMYAKSVTLFCEFAAARDSQ